MDILKKFFPFSFGSKNVPELVTKIIIYALGGVVLGVIFGFVAKLPFMDILMWPVGALTEIYIASAIALAILDYLKVIK